MKQVSEMPGAVIKRTAEDFQVRELPLVEAAGHGDHLLLRVRKRDRNTQDVAAMLADWAGVPRRDVSWAGMKDRRALTEQSFSIRTGPADPDPGTFDRPGVELLAVQRHTRKLQRGALRGNAFSIVLRELDGKAAQVAAAAARLPLTGAPNPFGAQRFGRAGGNLARARRWFAGGRPPRGRTERSLALSAARAALFNAVLEARVEAGDWATLQPGEWAMFDRGRSRFMVEAVDPALQDRCARGELHPTGPLWGAGGTEATAAMGEFERAIAAAEPVLAAGLERITGPDRRPLRMIPHALEARVLDADTLSLGFELPPGAYATALLSALVDWRTEDDRDD